jgi:transposase-like protein
MSLHEETPNPSNGRGALLPTPGRTRWTAGRKGTVVRAIQEGILDATDAKRRYLLSSEELFDWINTFEQDGIAGLYIKRLRPGLQRVHSAPG